METAAGRWSAQEGEDEQAPRAEPAGWAGLQIRLCSQGQTRPLLAGGAAVGSPPGPGTALRVDVGPLREPAPHLSALEDPSEGAPRLFSLPTCLRASPGLPSPPAIGSPSPARAHMARAHLVALTHLALLGPQSQNCRRGRSPPPPSEPRAKGSSQGKTRISKSSSQAGTPDRSATDTSKPSWTRGGAPLPQDPTALLPRSGLGCWLTPSTDPTVPTRACALRASDSRRQVLALPAASSPGASYASISHPGPFT